MRLVVVIFLASAATARAQAVDLAHAAQLLPGAPGCGDVECLIDHAYRGDAKAAALARALWADRGDVAGVGPDEHMDGGYRGPIHLVPALPVGRDRAHLEWVTQAMHEIDQFFADVFADGPAPPFGGAAGRGSPPADQAPRYRWRGLAFRFVRSVGKRTPSAYATGWAIEYNLAGSLLTSAGGVRETLIHELFHANDEDHGDWSAGHLQADYDAIVARCKTTRCLAPYAPGSTMVRGGTYYAFQPNNGNGVHEYAAELAVRYFREQREVLDTGKLARPAFKCGPPENARAWRGLVDEFFAGRDAVPAC